MLVNKGACHFQITSSPDPIVSRIVGFITLPDGWDYGRGRPISGTVAWTAISLSSSFKAMGAGAIEAFPRTGGGILVSAYQSDLTVDAALGADGRVTLTVEKGDEELYSGDKLSVSEVIKIVGGNNWLRRGTYDLSTHNIILAGSLGGLSPQALRNLLTEMVSLSSWSPVCYPANITYATTSKNSTPPVFPGSQQYFGDSKKPSFQKVA